MTDEVFETFETVWDAVGRSPEMVAQLKARSEMMSALEDHIKGQGWTQAQAARALGVTQPRISELMRGKFNAFGIELLLKMLARAGKSVEIRIHDTAPGMQAA